MNNVKTSPCCPICSSTSKFWDIVEEYRSIKEDENKKILFKLYKCNSCGHGFFYPGVKSSTDLIKYYDEEYAKEYDPDIEDESFVLRKKQYNLDVELIKIYIFNDKISVLDYGCSTGQFLNAMPKNWSKYGYEVNNYELKYISEHSKDIITFSEVSKIYEEFFDLITLRGVIEHLFDFNEIFSVINRCLKENGIIYICATPDFNSPCSVIYKSDWNQITAPIHYHQFTAASISTLFAKQGFGLKGLLYPYANTPYADFHNDAIKFINNVKKFLENNSLNDTSHPYPGTMMSLIFEKVQ